MLKVYLLLLFLSLAVFHAAIAQTPGQFYTRQSSDDSDEEGEDEVEFEDADKKDEEFDNALLSRSGRPESQPSESLVKEQYLIDFPGATKLSTVNLYVGYYQYSNWYTRYYRCCPKSQYYDCRSYRMRLPCFRYYANGQWEWCCPFYPEIYAYNCNCNTCVKQCPEGKCFAVGRCHRRYTYKTFYAICYRKGWDIARKFTRNVPSSCYCRASCCP